MSKPDTWMPLYIGDYIADTMHLTIEQHGAYLLLLMTAWNRGGRLPTDETQLANICRADKKTWARLRGAVIPFFKIEGDALVQPRLLEEYEKAVIANAKQKANGAKGGRPKKTQTITQQKPTGYFWDNPNHNPNESPSPSPINPLSEQAGSEALQPSGELPPDSTRKGRVCKLLRQAGMADAAPSYLTDETWAAIFAKRTDEEIVGVAVAKMTARPGQRTGLKYIAPVLLQDPQPIHPGATNAQNRESAADICARFTGQKRDGGTTLDGEAERVA